MAFGIETYVGGVPCIQTVQPFNLVYAVKVINLKPTPYTRVPPYTVPYTIPIVTGSAGDGELIMTMGDLGYYDKIVDLGGDGVGICRNLTFTPTQLSFTLESEFGSGGNPLPNGPLVFNFFRKR